MTAGDASIDAPFPHALRREPSIGVMLAVATAVTIAGIAGAIAWLWLDPTHTWIYPELLPVGALGAASDSLWAFLATLWNWQLFDPNPQRIRIVSDFLELIDAWARPQMAGMAIHPALSVTGMVYAVVVPMLVLATTRSMRFGRTEALLVVALLLATPGFLSNLFVYIRPAKPASFILLAWLVWFLVRTRDRDLTLRDKAELTTILAAGGFTDELLFWGAIFVFPARLILTGGLRALAAVAQCSMAAIATVLALQFLILPGLYDAFGADGPRTIALVDPAYRGGSGTVMRMLGYLVDPTFILTAIAVLCRSIGSHVGLVLNDPANKLALIPLLGVPCVLILTFRTHRRTESWQLAALATLGFFSYGAFGQWLQMWQEVPGVYYDLVSLNFYYNSPVSLFVVLLAGVGLRLMLRSARPAVAFVAPAAVVLVAWASISSFLATNSLLRFSTFAATDTVALYDGLKLARSGNTPAAIVVGRDFDEGFAAYDALGARLFGVEPRGNFRVPAFHFEQPKVFGSFEPVQYAEGVCAIYFARCPLRFVGAATSTAEGR